MQRRRLPARAIVALAGALVGCATPYHTVEPYSVDPVEAARLEARAVEVCLALNPRDGLPKKRFFTDGCSAFPDRGWVQCCVDHDIPYWCGGSAQQREDADEAFRKCVAKDYPAAFAQAMECGVGLGGHPLVPAPWRWGFGRPYGTGYEDPAPPAPDDRDVSTLR